jgi:hypothetical protein
VFLRQDFDPLHVVLEARYAVHQVAGDGPDRVEAGPDPSDNAYAQMWQEFGIYEWLGRPSSP